MAGIAVEYVEGESLAERLLTCRDGRPERSALDYVRQVAIALQHAHNRQLLHRDIKPENNLVTRGEQAKLTDLGLARALDRKANPRITQHGVTVGTPHYISPEQAKGTEHLTRATDLYALGATLYHLLTGDVPYDGKTCAAMMVRHIEDPVPDPRRLRPGLSAGASSICMKLMQKSPRERYPSAVSLAEDLGRLLERQPLRNVDWIPHPTRRYEPVIDRHPPCNGRIGRPVTGRGLDHIVSSIVKRLGL